MGLAANQARLLLLTAKNDSLELMAQMIEQERLILAMEQETIAQDYSDKTSNTIYTCRVVDETGATSQETMTLDSLAKSQAGGAGTASIILADANGTPIVQANASKNTDDDTTVGEWQMTYQVEVGGVMVDFDDNLKSSNPNIYNYYQNVIESLNANGSNTPLQFGISNGGYQLWIQDTSETANTNSTDQEVSATTGSGANLKVNDEFFVRKSPDSLSAVTSRYYTEDDAAAQAEYNTAMAKVNALDQRLENRLNQLETQRKAIEQEVESSKSIVQSNVERTFKYFS